MLILKGEIKYTPYWWCILCTGKQMNPVYKCNTQNFTLYKKHIHIPGSFACLYKVSIINQACTEFAYFNITVLNTLRHFKCFSQCFVTLFSDWNIAVGAYNMDSKWLKLAFCSRLCFILLRGDQNICGLETDGKLAGLCCTYGCFAL